MDTFTEAAFVDDARPGGYNEPEAGERAARPILRRAGPLRFLPRPSFFIHP